MPELYVSQTPFFNAGAYGIDQPFIVLHSAALELLDDDELRVLLSHELGHVMSGHALYRTIAAILALISLGALPMLASLAVLPVRLAFLEWSRKSELSADRAGLLGAQDVVAAQRLDMKMAGGGRGEGFARHSSTWTRSCSRPTSTPPAARGSTWSTSCSARWRSRIRCTPCGPRSCSAGSRAASTTGSSAASTPGAAPRPPTVRCATT